ncbi:MAG TPA: glutathione S-transferase family protein [Sandaracinaceae bacterium LLY-WYZ-13_1]|nr:glutathione S-transferase family protein [Sandaracinaceae bacterium LLY-WYZ-13_1]
MPTIVLYQFPGAYGLDSLSPFCTKLDVYLRLAGIEHETRLGDPREAPKGKLPYVRWDGALIGDSQIVLERCRTELGDPLDGRLDAAERARGHLVRRTCEEHLYWVLLEVRWGDDRIWDTSYRDAIASALPAAVRWFLPGLLRRGVIKSLKAQGLGRHARAEVVRMGEQDLDALATVVGDGPFLFGDEPTSFDCSLYAMVEHLRRTPGEHPLVEAVKARAPLVRLCDRMNERLAA